MSIHLTVQQKTNQMLQLAHRGFLDSAVKVLNTCDFSFEHQEKIQNILASISSNDSVKSIFEKKEHIFAILNNQQVPNIPLEVVVTIFRNYHPKSELSPISITCKNWNAVVVPEICAKQLKEKTSLTKGELDIYKKRMGFEDSSDWDCIFKHCKALNELAFSCLNTQSRFYENEIIIILESAAKYCPHIKILNFNGCDTVGKKTWDCIGKHYKGLTDLDLSSCSIIRPITNFNSMLVNCSQITSIKFQNNFIHYSIFFDICSFCPQLQKLDLFMTHGYAIMDSWIDVLGEKCPNLTHLTLPNSEITEQSLENLGLCCPKLQYLFVAGGHHRNSIQDGLANLQATLPNLVIQTGFDGIQENIDVSFEDSSEDSSYSDEVDYHELNNF